MCNLISKFVIFAMFIMATQQTFGQLYEVPLDQRIEQSAFIIEGEVLRSSSFRGTDENIYTSHTVRIARNLNGKQTPKTIEVITFGGQVDDEVQTWTHLLTLNVGDKGLFFLNPTKKENGFHRSGHDAFDVYASSQGFIQYQTNESKALIAKEPFREYLDIDTDLLHKIEQKTGFKASQADNEANSLFRSGIRFHFKDIQFDGLTVKFDLYVNSLVGNKVLNSAGVQLSYNPAFFGSSVVANGGLALNEIGISLDNGYDFVGSDLSSSSAKISLIPNPTLGDKVTIGVTEQLLGKGYFVIKNPLVDPGITYQIEQSKALNTFIEEGQINQFDTVVVEGSWRESCLTITDFMPKVVSAGTSDIITISGICFGDVRGSSRVEFTNAFEGTINGVDWIEPLDTDYVTWSDTKIEVAVPSVAKGGVYTEYAGTGRIRVKVGSATKESNEKLTVVYAADNRAIQDVGASGLRRKKVRLVGDWSEDSGYTLYYNDDLTNLNGARQAFERAVCTWVQSSGVNFRIKKLADISLPYQPYACKILLSNSLPAGTNSSTKAITSKDYHTACFSNGVTNMVSLKRFDIYFRKSGNWYTSQNYDPTLPFSFWENNLDFESYALHELGHAQLLLHVNQTAEVMYNEVVTPNRALLAGDIMGGSYIKGISIVDEPNCSLMPMIPMSDCGLIPTVEPSSHHELIRLSPNPASDKISFFHSQSIQSIRILNTLGQLVFESEANFSGPTINISNLPLGFYFLNTQIDNCFYSTKFEKL